MAAKKKEDSLTIEDKLKAALVPEAEQPYPIPGNWAWTRVGNLSFLITKGSTPTSYGFSYKNEGIRFIKTENIDEYGRITPNTDFIDEATNAFLKRSILHDKDILFSIAGTIGRIGIIEKEMLPANTNQALAIIRCNWNYLNNKYLFYYLKSEATQRQSTASIVGVGRANVSLRDIGELIIPLPSLNEQRRIAEKLESLLGKIKEAKTLLDEIPEILQNFRQSVLAAACSGRLTEDWREKNPDVIGATGSDALSGRGTASPLQNDLPETWVASRFDQVFDINPGHKNIPIDNNLNISFVPMNLIEEETGKINTNISKKYKEVKNGYTKFIEDDVLFAKITPCMENGKIAIAQNLINGIGCGTTELHVFRPFIKGMSKYLFYFLLQKTIREQAKRRFQGTSGHMRVPSEFFHDLFFPLPPLEEQTEIVRRVESIFSKADDIESQYKAAMELIEAVPEIILSKAFRGELVPQDPSDEPASVLLKKMRGE